MPNATSLSNMLASAVILVLSGCATSTQVARAPLEESRQQELRSTLVGTWKHVASKSSKNAEPEPVETATVTWTFCEDGTGTFEQTIPSVGRDDSREFEWRLEGRNIVLSHAERDEETHYRADSWSDEEMTWFNYGVNNYYLLESVSE